MYPFSHNKMPYNSEHRKDLAAVETVFEQGSGSRNEDILLKDDRLYGVFDGATSLDNFLNAEGKSGGLLAAQAAAETFAGNGASLYDLACQANENIRELMGRSGANIEERHTLWSTSAAIVRIDGNELEWLQIGDSLVLALYADGSHHLLADPVNHDRETLCLWKEKIPTATGTIQETLAEQIIKVRQGMNIDYGVLNGEKQAQKFFQHGKIPLTGITDIILYTDGLFLPQTDPAQDNDHNALANLYRQDGLKGVHKRVRKLQKEDPYCITYPRFKLHDDIAAIALRFHAT